MPQEEETGFTFVDKRRTTAAAAAEATPAPQPAETAQSEPPPAATQPPPEMDLQSEMHSPDGMHRLSVRDRIIMCIDILNQGAWISLGLVHDPVTGEVSPDLDQAKQAIDAVAYLAGLVESQFDDETRREVKNLVRDLQLNYVEQRKRSGAGA